MHGGAWPCNQCFSPYRPTWLACRHFCNPKYDASAPLPARILPPHAPPSASEVDDWRLFNSSLGGKLPGAKSREEFVRYLHLRDVDWRNAFHRGLAEQVAEFKKEQRVKAEQRRQAAWQEYRERIFAEALVPAAAKQQSLE